MAFGNGLNPFEETGSGEANKMVRSNVIKSLSVFNPKTAEDARNINLLRGFYQLVCAIQDSGIGVVKPETIQKILVGMRK